MRDFLGILTLNVMTVILIFLTFKRHRLTSGAFVHWCIEFMPIDCIDSDLRCLNLYVINVPVSVNMTSAVSDVVLK